MTNELTKAQKEEYALKREIALKNLSAKSKIVDLATAFYVEQSGAYGEAGGSAVDQYKYRPALNSPITAHDLASGGEYSLMQNALLASRQGASEQNPGRRYSGNVNEYHIIQSCARIVQESLDYLTVQDVLSIIGSKETAYNKIKGRYLKELGDEAKPIIQMYLSYLTDSKVSEALGERAKATGKGLEKILTTDPATLREAA